jgi:hypothetical protein
VPRVFTGARADPRPGSLTIETHADPHASRDNAISLSGDIARCALNLGEREIPPLMVCILMNPIDLIFFVFFLRAIVPLRRIRHLA